MSNCGNIFIWALLTIFINRSFSFNIKSSNFFRSLIGSSSTLKSLLLSMSSDDGGKAEADDVWGAPVGPLPSVSSKINFGNEVINIKHDLWVVGSGTLGELLIKQWKAKFPESTVIAETLTEKRHPFYQKIGVEGRIRSNRTSDDMKSAKHLVICLPPSAALKGYMEEISNATMLWAGPLGGGSMVFTSSIGVYGESNGNTVTEDFRVDTRSPRATNMLSAEEAVFIRDGNVIRLAGLYTETRGPHTFWLKKAERGETIDTNSDGLVNMLHYEDAAAATIAALLADQKKKIFMAVDDEPVSKMEICLSAVASKLFPDATVPQFASDAGALGKLCDDSKSRETLKWEPKYKSFRTFMRRLGGEEIADPVKKSSKKDKASVLWLPGDDDDDF